MKNELLARANCFKYRTLGQVASELNWSIPLDLTQAKGWPGQLIETYLGATAGNAAVPDFPDLGIEVKTLPLNAQGQPQETTYVTTLDWSDPKNRTWETSSVHVKLAHVLWVPLEGSREIPISQRRIGEAFLWQANPKQLAQLKQDWQEITDKINLGQDDELVSQLGEYLHIRPKAANNRVLTRAQTSPKGFYLRKSLTTEILGAKCGIS